MYIVIDVNTLSFVFNPENKRHEEFKPVFTWILKCKGKMVYGGTTYNKEISKSKKFRRLILELKKATKAIPVDDNAVDEKEKSIEKKLVHRDFNDAHIIAIVIVSMCNLICSGDKKSYRFLRKKELYPKHFKRPKIYSGRGNEHLLYN